MAMIISALEYESLGKLNTKLDKFPLVAPSSNLALAKAPYLIMLNGIAPASTATFFCVLYCCSLSKCSKKSLTYQHPDEQNQ